MHGSRILIRSDNTTTVQSLNTRRSHSPLIQQCLRVFSLSLQLQHLVHIGYKSSFMTHTQLFMQPMLLAHSRICNPTFVPTYFFAFPLVILINSCQSQYSATTWFFYHVHWLMAPSRITYLLYVISMNCSPSAQICTMTFTYTLLFVVYSVNWK